MTATTADDELRERVRPRRLRTHTLPGQTQDSAEFAIADGYLTKQVDCTPDMPRPYRMWLYPIPALLASLKDTDWQTQHYAAMALEAITGELQPGAQADAWAANPVDDTSGDCPSDSGTSRAASRA